MIDPERTRILEQIAGSVKNPVFHIGDPRPDTNYLGDSFGAILSRRIPDSLGSGLYMTSNIQDVLEWNTYKTNKCRG